MLYALPGWQGSILKSKKLDNDRLNNSNKVAPIDPSERLLEVCTVKLYGGQRVPRKSPRSSYQRTQSTNSHFATEYLLTLVCILRHKFWEILLQFFFLNLSDSYMLKDSYIRKAAALFLNSGHILKYCLTCSQHILSLLMSACPFNLKAFIFLIFSISSLISFADLRCVVLPDILEHLIYHPSWEPH